MSKITIEQIKDTLAQDKWKLISQEYKNLDSELVFECDEGHKVYSTWKKQRDKRFCPICQQNQLKQMTKEIISKPKGAKRTLALDQASHLTGWAIFDNEQLVKYGKFEAGGGNDDDRINQIRVWLNSMIINYSPDLIAFEGIQLQDKSENRQMGVVVFQKLAWLQGVLINTAYQLKIPYEICHTATWRNYCGIKGKTRTDRKRAMQILAKDKYDVSLSEDEADAVGIGYYASHTFNKVYKIESWE